MNTKKIFSSAALAASLTLAAGAAFAWGCGAGSMMGYGPGCQVDPQGAYPGCQYGPNGMMRRDIPAGLTARKALREQETSALALNKEKFTCAGPSILPMLKNQLLKLISAPLMPIIR